MTYNLGGRLGSIRVLGLADTGVAQASYDDCYQEGEHCLTWWVGAWMGGWGCLAEGAGADTGPKQASYDDCCQQGRYSVRHMIAMHSFFSFTSGDGNHA